MFTDYQSRVDATHVVLGDNSRLEIAGQGDLQLKLLNGTTLNLCQVLHVPGISKNLLSVGKLASDLNLTLQFTDDACYIFQKGISIAQAHIDDDLYLLEVADNNLKKVKACFSELTPSMSHSKMWYIGHPNKLKLQEMTKLDLYTEKFLGNYTHLPLCEVCIRAKQHVTPYPTDGATRASSPLQLLHMDLCGPVFVPSLGRGRYILTIVDDYSRYTWIRVLQRKSKTFSVFRQLHVHLEKQTGKPLVKIRTDNGGEFNSDEFNEYCNVHGIARQLTTPYSSAQNGVAERKNCSLQETTHALIKQAHLPLNYWGEAVTVSAYLHNQIPGNATAGRTPFELYYGTKPSIAHLRIFGSDAYAH